MEANKIRITINGNQPYTISTTLPIETLNKVSLLVLDIILDLEKKIKKGENTKC